MERNVLLDYLKIFISIFIVCSHMQPLFGYENFGGWYISNGIGRLAVPLFFIINGFFICSKLDDYQAVKKYVKHLILIYLVWTLIYSPFFITSVRVKDIIAIILTGYYHLWYMPAVIIAIILLYFIKKYIKNDYYILLFGLILYIVGFILSHYANKIFYYRNGITIGFIFVAIGYFIKSKQVEKYFRDVHLILIICTTVIAITIESYYRFVTTQGNPFQDFLFFILVLSPSIFILVIKHPKYVSNKGFINIVSSGIYFLHPLAMTIVNVPDEYRIYRLLPVLLVSVILSYIVYLINKRLKIFF